MIMVVVALFAIVPVPLFSVVKPIFSSTLSVAPMPDMPAVMLFLTLLAMTMFLAAAPSMNMPYS